MISGHRNIRHPQRGIYRLHILPGRAVDDPAFAPVLFYVFQKLGILAAAVSHLKIQVRPVKSCHQHFRIPKLQHALYIFLNFLRCRRREGADHRTHRKTGYHIHNVQIAGPEVLSPLGYAVRFIHRHHADLYLSRKILEQISKQPFRSHIDDLILSPARQRKCLLNLSLRQGTVDIRCMNARFIQSAHLVFHKRNQRRDNNRNPRQEQRRNLIAYRFARTGRHDAQHIPAGQDCFYQRFLRRPETVIAKIFLQYVMWIHPSV